MSDPNPQTVTQIKIIRHKCPECDYPTVSIYGTPVPELCAMCRSLRSLKEVIRDVRL
jgi:hypothetical protein